MDLDIQRVIGTAPGAHVDLVWSHQLYSAIEYEIETLMDPIMTLSYSSCEFGTDPHGAYWTQAAAEGISVFASSGDVGAQCNDELLGSPPPSAHISIMCASPEVTCA